jgi:hypothetical protein
MRLWLLGNGAPLSGTYVVGGSVVRVDTLNLKTEKFGVLVV